MRFFELLTIQHFIAYFFPALITLILVGLALHYSHFQTKDAEERMNRIIHRYPLGLEERPAVGCDPMGGGSASQSAAQEQLSSPRSQLPSPQ